MPQRSRIIDGPFTATLDDIAAINRVFSSAFTERYHRDGMSGVRVPPLNPAVWQYAIRDAAEGAFLWRDDAGEIAAFNMVHRSGREGWMGPLAVRPDQQGRGLGRRIVTTAIDHLRRAGAVVIGLETMPRTIDNIGFYSGLGFRPGHLTVTVARDLLRPAPDPAMPAVTPGDDWRHWLPACAALSERLAPHADFAREIELTHELDLGGLTLIERDDGVAGFALWHTAPLAEGRNPDELRALKLVAADLPAFRELVLAVTATARLAEMGRFSLRCQTAYGSAYATLLELGFRPHWTDLRMTLADRSEQPPAQGVVFSNWEI